MKLLNFRDVKVGNKIVLNGHLVEVTVVNPDKLQVSPFWLDEDACERRIYWKYSDQDINIFVPENEEELTMLMLGCNVF